MTKPQETRAPAFQFYPDDYLSDDAVEAMTLAEQGAYMRLLCHAWKSKRPGHLANDDDLLARLSRLGTNWKRSKPRILRAFRISDDGAWLVQKRMVATHETQAAYRKNRQEAGSKGATQRWEKTRRDDGTATGLPMANDSSSSSSPSAEEIDPPLPPKGEARGADLSPTSSVLRHPVPNQPPADESKAPKKGDANAVVDGLLGELSDARVRLRPASRPIVATAAARKYIAARLEDGHTPDDVRHVIAVCEAECRRYRGPEDKDPFQWFNTVTPFRPDNFQLKLARQAPAATVTPLHGERRSTFKARPDEVYGNDFITQLMRQEGEGNAAS